MRNIQKNKGRTLVTRGPTKCLRFTVQAWIDETDNSVGIYNIFWITEGGCLEDLLHYALPHHQVHVTNTPLVMAQPPISLYHKSLEYWLESISPQYMV